MDPQILIQHYSSVRNIAKDFMQDVADLNYLPGLWIHGKAGCGKSRMARKYYPGAYLKNVNKWWDGYKGEDYVIIDDWDPSHDKVKYHLKIWADRYAFTAEIKGGAIKIRPKWIIITSQYHPYECFTDIQTFDAIKRRFVILNLK